jgi:hypothetical protein
MTCPIQPDQSPLSPGTGCGAAFFAERKMEAAGVESSQDFSRCCVMSIKPASLLMILHISIF